MIAAFLCVALALSCAPPYLRCKDERPLEGSTLRVHFIGGDRTELFEVDAFGRPIWHPAGAVLNCATNTTCSGSLLELYEGMRQWAGFTAVDVPLSPEAQDHAGATSPWTDCACE